MGMKICNWSNWEVFTFLHPHFAYFVILIIWTPYDCKVADASEVWSDLLAECHKFRTEIITTCIS